MKPWPSDGKLWEAHALSESGDYAAAATAYREIVKVDESDTRVWVSLGHCLVKLRHWSEAIDALDRGIALRPAYAEADARLYLVDALVGSGNIARARRELEHIIGMEPSYPSDELPMQEARRRLAQLSPKK